MHRFKLRHLVKRTPIIREITLFLYRLSTVMGYFIPILKKIFIWLFQSKEYTNYTYDLAQINKQYLATLVASVTGRSHGEIFTYMKELENDEILRDHIRTVTQSTELKYFSDNNIYFGRRLGWYAFARAIKPRVIVETGVDKGLGSCVLTAALMKNQQEGYTGYYYGTDINPNAGYLLAGKYKEYGQILYGDSIKSLEKLDKEIDLFVNDSDHSAEYEALEYETISNKLTRFAIILGDNSHITTKLVDFALRTNREFVFFQEKPLNHWYPGAGIGIAYRDNNVPL